MPHPIHVSVVPTGPPEAEIISLTSAIRFLRVTTQDPTTTGNAQDDDLINALIVGARELLEKHTWRSLAKRGFVQYMDSFPRQHFGGFGLSGSRRVHNRGHRREHLAIKLWYPPLIECDSIVYIGLDGVEHTLTSGKDFQVDFASEPGRLFPLQGQFWPDTMHGVANAVRIPFTAGYEVESVEEPLGQTDIEAIAEPEANQVGDLGDALQQVARYTIDRTIPQPLATAVSQLVTHWWLNRSIVVAQAGAGGKFNALPWHIEQMVQAYRCWDWALTAETES